MLGLHCSLGFSLVPASGRYGLAAMHTLLIMGASLVAEHGLEGTRASVVLTYKLSNRGALALLLCGMWDLSGPGIKPVSPALAGSFFTTEPPGKPLLLGFADAVGAFD